ncbi:MAG: CrcB family protein [Candidatus Nanopelagicales bacterium]|jgi:CrcB protein|nr:CrcB family protein [Candidatus Nanopelagicales bacterium]
MMWLAVVAGAAVGAPLRYLVETSVTSRMRHHPWHQFTWGLHVVNVAGSLVAGVVLATTTGVLRALLLAGFCGAFTTFSGFAWRAHSLRVMSRSAWWWTIITMPTACIAAFWIAWRLAS